MDVQSTQTPPNQPVSNEQPTKHSPISEFPLSLIFIILAAVVMAFAVAFYFMSNQKASQHSQNNQPTRTEDNSLVTISPTVPSVNDITASWEKYTSPCISFKYPPNFQKDSDKVTTDHKIVREKDIYGTSSVDFKYQTQVGVGYVQISCLPNFSNLTNSSYLQQELNGFNTNASKKIQGDGYQYIILGGKQALRTFINAYNNNNVGRIGLDDTYTVDEHYIYTFEMEWPTSADNDQRLPEHILFNTLLSTVNFPPPVSPSQ